MMQANLHNYLKKVTATITELHSDYSAMIIYNSSMKSKPLVVVGMSGGVDSSLTALLLKEDYEVRGVTLKLRNAAPDASSTRSCGNAKAIDRAQRAADEIGVPLHIVDCSDKFQGSILEKCWRSFESGCTPNPCHICNASVKFVELLSAAGKLGAEKIATGHYARIVFDEHMQPVLKRGVDTGKDQSYFLSGLSSEILSHTLFPLGTMLKKDVKALAEKHGLTSSELKESQDLCFHGPEGHFSNALRELFSGKAVPGIFVDEAGNTLGTHTGIHQYTIGQRRGLGFATGKRVKIVQIDPQNGTIVVSAKKEAARSEYCKAAPFTWSRQPLQPGEQVMGQVRYRQSAVEATILLSDNNSLEVRFSRPVFGVTPGQVLVLYKEDSVLGSGVISR